MGLSDNRVTLYIRPRKDDDIREFLSAVDKGDRSWLVRDLVRDGIKYRNMGNNTTAEAPTPTPRVAVVPTPTPKAPEGTPPEGTPPEEKTGDTKVIEEQVSTAVVPDFSNIKLQRVEVNSEELDKKLDAL